MIFVIEIVRLRPSGLTHLQPDHPRREVAPLKPADDALLLDSTTLSIDEVIAQALDYIQQKASISI